VGPDTGHGPVVETGGGLVAIAAAADRADFLGGHSGGVDLAGVVAGPDVGQQAPPRGWWSDAGAPAYPV